MPIVLKTALALSASVAALILPVAPAAAQEQRQSYDLPAQPLSQSLREVSLRSGRNIVAPAEILRGRTAPAVRGAYTLEEVVNALLAGSGLVAKRAGDGLVIARMQTSQEDTAADEPGSGEIVVTGTRIRGSGPVGSAVTVLDRAAMDRSGYATTQDIAQTIPQNFGGSPNEGAGAGSFNSDSGFNTAAGSSINLRGLGTGSTLVLLNGDRPPLGGFSGVFSDISMIPASAIERIEIVADGASAIYGSDAVAGVVNIIPRTDFVGGETRLRIGTADGNSQDLLASQLVGTGWSSGQAMIAYEYYRRTELAAADRDYATDDLRNFGGTDNRTRYASPGTIIAANGRTFAIPRGQDGRGLTANDLTPGTFNPGNDWDQVDLLPDQRRHSVFAAARQELAPGVRLYARGLYSSRRFTQRERPISNTARTVPVTNPFYVDPIGTGQPVRVQYSFVRDLGPETTSGRVEAYGASVGVEADLAAWNIDVHGTWGRQSERTTIANRVNSARLNAALADTDAATAYNLFGDGPSTNPATIARVRGSTRSGNTGTVWSAALRADGPLFALPGGEVRLALGGEYREERYEDRATISDVSTLTPVALSAIALPGPRRVRAAYGELHIPVFGEDMDVPGIRRLDLSAAVRTERYSDFGTTTNPKFGASWEPVRGLTLRGSWGKSFRAPSFNNLRQDPANSLFFAYTLPDPASPTGQTNVLVLRGNDPGLRPERATSWTLGLDVRPPSVPGLYGSLTYYNIRYRDRIASPAANLLNFLVNRETYQGIIDPDPSLATIQGYYASPVFQNPFNLAPEQIELLIDARLQNLSTVEQSGLDLDLGYSFDALGGKADLGLTGAYIFHIRQALTATAASTDVVDRLGNPVDLHLRARAGWSDERLSVSLFGNYLDSYTNLTNATPQTVEAWTTFDLQLSYRFGTEETGSDLRVALSATNLLDRDPPKAAYFLGTFSAGFDPDNASPLGRVLSLTVTKRW
ncbi:TonB-dependent receptor [Sphingomonas koreensis]|uniref:TonB-dependent receptor n=1 Tax=Sphingomonas koreensis TaxID=93064 RepID=UPI00234F5E3D|nr:TonB-dependent receptor [Sphingomonas koreensis]MDC7810945.1 TonB-dependent receptor [Sphingomonas koreensis]